MSRPLRRSNYQRAVGLAFDAGRVASPADRANGSHAPQVTVAGQELEADLIVRLARKYGIPVVEKPAIAQLLSQLPLDREIPPDLYRAVATILAELDRGKG